MCFHNFVALFGLFSPVVGEDLNAFSTFVNFSAGETIKTVSIDTIDDTDVESLEMFQVKLNKSSSSIVLGVPNEATVNIADNDGKWKRAR